MLRKKRIYLLLFILVLLSLLYCVIPYKITLSAELSQLVFVYDSEDSIDIQQQVSYTLGEFVSKTSSLEKDTGNTTLYINKFILFKWLNDCKKELNYFNSEGIEVNNNNVTVNCEKEDVPQTMIYVDAHVRYLVVKQLLSGVSPEKINVKVTFIEKSSGNILIYADWPKEIYNIDRELFFDENR